MVALHLLADNDNKIEMPISITDSSIEVLDGTIIEFIACIEIINCQIGSINFHGVKIQDGILIKDCLFYKGSDFSCGIYEAGNHDVIIKGNTFNNIVTFEDTSFLSPVKLVENNFKEGCDIHTSKQLSCSYHADSLIRNNEGKLDLSIVEEKMLWQRLRDSGDLK